jgi:SAM-dependent methyltransferase
MRISAIKNFLNFLTIYIYLSLSVIHWLPRKNAIQKQLESIINYSGKKSFRIVDIGCGPGLLVNTVAKMGLEYLGIDNDSSTIQYCVNQYNSYKNVQFDNIDITGDWLTFSSSDIIVLNGVVHHLKDAQLFSVLKKASSCFAIIICDHLKKEQELQQVFDLIPNILQKLDRGKYVRKYSFFKYLRLYHLHQANQFPIRLFKINLWTYFCHLYKPVKSN